MFSGTLPENVRPGEKVFVVVDGTAYQIVNDDGSDIGSCHDQQVANVVASLPSTHTVCDNDSLPEVVPNACESSERVAVGGLVSARQNSVCVKSAESNAVVVVPSDALVNSTSDTSKSSQGTTESATLKPMTVLAENDDEFEHLSTAVSDSLAPSDSRPTAADTASPSTFVDSFLGFVRGGNPLRPHLPKIVLQARPRLVQLTARPAVRPARVTFPNIPVLTPRQPDTTSTNFSEKVVREQPAMVTTELPKKNALSVTVTAVSSVKPSRQPRTPKRMSP